MAEKTTKKTNKKNTKVVENKTTKKVTTTKAAPKKVTPKKETKEVVKVETPKEIKKEGNLFSKDGKVVEIYNKIIANKPFAISLCVILVLTISLICTICYKRIPKTKEGNQVLATIKGKTFTADDLYLELKDTYGTDKLINMIDNYITNKEVKFTKENEEYIQDIVDSWKAQAESYGMSLADLVSNYGLMIDDEEDFYDYLKQNYSMNLAVEKFVGDQASEKDLKEYYNNNYSDTYTVRHVLIEVNDDTTDSDALNKAKDIIEELNNTDKDSLEDKFIELAKNNSDDPGSYSNGGLIENVTKASVVSEFFEASSKLKDGEYTTEPVKSSYGYHVIYKVSTTKLKDFKELKDEVKSKYAQELLSSDATLQVTKWDELRKSYKMNIIDDNIKNKYEETIDNNKKIEE